MNSRVCVDIKSWLNVTGKENIYSFFQFKNAVDVNVLENGNFVYKGTFEWDGGTICYMNKILKLNIANGEVDEEEELIIEYKKYAITRSLYI